MNWSAYNKGSDACKQLNHDTTKNRNPYKKESENWKSWNKGWNEYGMAELKLTDDQLLEETKNKVA